MTNDGADSDSDSEVDNGDEWNASSPSRDNMITLLYGFPIIPWNQLSQAVW